MGELHYYVRRESSGIQGPFVLKDLIHAIQHEALGPNDQISKDKIHWDKASKHPELYDAFVLILDPQNLEKPEPLEAEPSTEEGDLEEAPIPPPPSEDILQSHVPEPEVIEPAPPVKNKKKKKKTKTTPPPKKNRTPILIGLVALIAFVLWQQKTPPSKDGLDASYTFNIQTVLKTLPESSENDPYLAEKKFYEAQKWFFKDTPYHYVLAAEGYLKSLELDHTFVASLSGYFDALSHLHRLKLLSPERYTRAFQLMVSARRRFPQSPLILRSIALGHILRGNHSKAEEQLITAQQRLPQDPLSELYYGYLYSVKQKYTKTVGLLVTALSHQKQNKKVLVFGYYLLSNVYTALKNYDKAAQAYKIIYKLNPIHPYLIFHLAQQAYAQTSPESHAIAQQWVQTLAALGLFLPVDLHRFTYQTLLENADSFELTPKKQEAIAIFLKHYHPALADNPKLLSYFNAIPKPLPKEKLEESRKELFFDLPALRTVAEQFFQDPSKSEVGVDLFLVSLRLDPAQADVYQKLGDYYGFIQTPEAQSKSLTFYEKSLSYNPGLKEVVFKVFRNAMTYYDYRTAANVLHKYKEHLREHSPKTPPDYRLWLSYGELYHAIKDIPKAIEYYKKARSLVPTDVRILKQMSKIAAEAGYTTDAIVLARQALKFSKNDPEIMSRISILSAVEGRRKSSLVWPKKRIANSPDDDWGHLTLGEIYFHFKEYEKATFHLKKGLAKRSDYQLGWETLANIYRELGKIDEAIGAYQKISIETGHPDGYVKAGNYAHSLDLKEQALKSYLKAVKLNFRYPDLNIKIARLFRELNYPNEAIRYFQRSIELNPRKIDFQIELGDYLVENKYYQIAEAYFISLLENYPKNIVAMIYVARMNRYLGRFKKAHDFSQKAYKLDPKSPDANKELGLAYYYLQERKVAKSYLDTYLELNPSAEDRREIKRLLRK